MSTTTKLKLSDGKEIVITLLPLRAYGEFLIALQDTLKEMASEWDGAESDDIIAKLPEFITDHLDEAGKIIEIGTRGQISATDAIDKYGLADAVEVLSALIEVNDVNKIAASVKKAMATFRKTKTQPATK